MKKKYLVFSITVIVLMVFLVLEALNFMFRVSTYNIYSGVNDATLISTLWVLMIGTSSIGIILFILLLVFLSKKKSLAFIIAIINSIQIMLFYNITAVLNHINDIQVNNNLEINNPELDRWSIIRMITRLSVITVIGVAIVVLSIICYKILKKKNSDTVIVSE